MIKNKSTNAGSFSPPFGGVGGGFEPRTYRNQFSLQRFRSFFVNYKETDLCIGVDPGSFKEEMKEFTHSKVIQLRSELEAYL